MSKRIKKYMKIIGYRIRFRGRHVKIDWSCQLSADDLECEGMNVFHKNVTFRGKIGYGSYIGERSRLNAVIGRYCSISSDVKTISGTHPTYGFVSTHPAFFSTNKQAGFTYVTENCFREDIFADNEMHLVRIGNDVWIGSNVLLLPGISIGDGAIIAAGAVVTKDIEPYSIVGGVPAKVIRKRFSEEKIEALVLLKWWNWGEKFIAEKADCFQDIDKFLSMEVNDDSKETSNTFHSK